MESLSNDLLYNILKHLKQQELLKCATVCMKFNEIIKSFKLISTLFIQSSCDSSLSVFNRKYSKVIIKANNDANISKALQSTGDSIVDIKFELSISTFYSISKTLNYLPNIKDITFYFVHIDDDEEVKDLVQPKAHPVNLHFFESDPKIFKVLTNLSAKSLELRLLGDTACYNFEPLSPFMAKQKELTSFSVSDICDSNLMHECIPKGDYHLTEFGLSNSDLADWICLETYLNDHADSLEKLFLRDFWSYYDPSPIIKACSNLKQLEILEDGNDKNISIDELDEDITSVQELSIDNPSLTIAKFTNLKKLFIQNAIAEANRVILGRDIEDLTVKFGTVEGIQCNKLTKLRLINIESPINEEFFKIHSKVEELKLENLLWLNDDLLEVVVKNLPNLKVLTIYGTNDLTSHAFEIIKTHCKKLRVLDTKDWTQRYSIAEWKCLFKSNNGIEIYHKT